jgi:hypothetical protein
MALSLFIYDTGRNTHSSLVKVIVSLDGLSANVAGKLFTFSACYFVALKPWIRCGPRNTAGGRECIRHQF